MGPTAAGKSAIAEGVAERFGAAIVSVDSMQVYRGMDIGTAKPAEDTTRRIDYRMLDVCEPSEELSVQRYQKLARSSMDEIADGCARVVIAGGSGLHFRSIVDPMTFAPTDTEVREALEALPVEELRAELLAADPHAGAVVDLGNPRRVIRAVEVWRITGDTPTERASRPEARALRSYEPVVPFTGFGIDAGETSQTRVRTRLTTMLEDGLLEEVERLQGAMGRTAAKAVGYKQYGAVVTGAASLEDAFDDTVRATNALVKRQRTFFRRDPRITWMSCQDGTQRRRDEAVTTIGEAMQWSS